MKNKETLWSKNFTIITIGTVISAIGGVAMNVALSLVVFDNTSSTWMTGLFTASSMLPTVILPILLGPYIDSHKRKTIIFSLDGIMGIIYILFASYVVVKGFNYITYMIFGIITGAIGSIYSTAYSALYPELIPKGFMQKGYSISSIIYPTVTVFISPISAILYQNYGIHLLLFAEGILLLITSGFEMLISIDETSLLLNNSFNFKSYFNQISEALKYLKEEKGVQGLYGYMAITNGMGNGVNLMIMAYFQSSSFLTTAMYSLLISSETLGRMLGGVIHYIIKIPTNKRYKIAELVYKIYNILDATLLFLPYIGMLISRFICGFLGVNSATLREVAVQSYIPPSMRARISSLLTVSIQFGVMVSQLLAGALGEVLSYRLVAVIFSLIGMLCVYLLIVRNKKSIQPLFEANN
ncbi:MAG: MFS transporter [Clostridium sp.]|uniref:MFS transporter n=1 Tax=Clostridium sp. TaxID=1506 RepID=UPI0025C04356|nr:MFS transporter [Clostridium sp.]MBS5928441.1 MFS transporter [Clostridium sp.]